MSTMNIIHNIDVDVVDKQILCACQKYLRLCDTKIEWAKELQIKFKQNPDEFARKPDTVDEVESMYANWIAREKEHYSLVRVIELHKKDKRFILVYGDVDNKTVTSGTGPFESLERAIGWFVNGGR